MTFSSAKFIGNLKIYYKYLGIKMVIGVVLSLLVGFLDGIGLSLFLPLLTHISTDSPSHTDTDLVSNFLTGLGIEINLTNILAVILLVFVTKGIVKFIESYVTLNLQVKFSISLRTLAINSLASYKYESFVKADIGRIQNSLTEEIGRVVNGFNHYYSSLQNAAMIIVYVSLALSSNLQFSILVGAGGLASNLLFRRIYMLSKKYSTLLSDRNNTYHKLLSEALNHFKYLSATSRIDSFRDRVKASIDSVESMNRKLGLIKAVSLSIREPIIFSVILLSIYIQSAVFDQPVSIVIISLMFFYRALTFFMLFQGSWTGYLSMSGSYKNFFNLISDIQSNSIEKSGSKVTKFNSEIEFKNITFSYNSSKAAIDGISLKIPKNKTISIVGESGSGKTTLINLLCGLIQPTGGDLLFDGIKYSELSIRDLQSRIGYITQEPVVFDESVFNNITFWSVDNEHNSKRFKAAIQRASLEKVIEALPEKEQTILGNNGVTVSGGQRQRLSIARELFREIDILILDEATSALDSDTERLIQQSIKELHGSCTIIIVAHRLSTVRDSDTILLMENGRVSAQGTFNDLRETNQVFRRMVELQEL